MFTDLSSIAFLTKNGAILTGQQAVETQEDLLFLPQMSSEQVRNLILARVRSKPTIFNLGSRKLNQVQMLDLLRFDDSSSRELIGALRGVINQEQSVVRKKRDRRNHRNTTAAPTQQPNPSAFNAAG